MFGQNVIANISKEEVELFSRYVLNLSGIYLGEGKGYLLENRLKPILDECRLSSYGQLYDKIRADVSGKMEKKLVDAISTNETFFFRDSTPFELMRNKIIPELIDRRKKECSGPIPIRVWSAASSTGQEIYSIAITLLEMLAGMGSYDIFILGTDISSKAISQASYGKYSQFEIERGLPVSLRNKYFSKVDNNSWRVNDKVRSLVKFEKINLMLPFGNIGTFDLVFCRNVAIYFQNRDKVNLFAKIARVISPGGSLIVGGSENLTNIAPDFVTNRYLKGIYYTLKKEGFGGEQKVGMSRSANLPSGASKAKSEVFVRPARKTVYDKKVKPVSKKQESPGAAKSTFAPLPQKSARPMEPEDLAAAQDKSPEPPVAEVFSKRAVSLVDKLSGDHEQTAEGKSLLGNLGGNKGGESSLLDGKRPTGKKSKSLLENIKKRSSEK